MRIPFVVLLAAAAPLFAAGRPVAKIKSLLAHSPVLRAGYAGVLVVDDRGHPILSINSDRAFIPASNLKLFSTALALERLGPEKRFQTRVEQRGNDLVIVGMGDANLSGRVLPYQYDSAPGPSLAAIDDLAVQIASHGIQEVKGDVIGDDTAFVYEPFAPGWAAEDVLYDDGAPVSALVVNDNCLTMKLTPGVADGTPTTISLDPPLSLFDIENHSATGAPDKVETDRVPGTALWRIWGTLAAGAHPHVELWAADDPARFAALALKYSLERHGISVAGSARARHRFTGIPFVPPPGGAVVAERQSLPLLEDLRVIAKTSNNLHADLLLFDVGGSREAGLEALARFLGEAGVKPEGYRFYDGSGLSRMNLVTPAAVVGLLRFMANSPHREDWLSLLPVSGIDGSLATRLTGKRVKGRIHAKTGSLNHVSALSGYLDTQRGKRLTFSIFVNNATAGTLEQRDLIDKICSLLVEL